MTEVVVDGPGWYVDDDDDLWEVVQHSKGLVAVYEGWELSNVTESGEIGSGYSCRLTRKATPDEIPQPPTEPHQHQQWIDLQQENPDWVVYYKGHKYQRWCQVSPKPIWFSGSEYLVAPQWAFDAGLPQAWAEGRLQTFNDVWLDWLGDYPEWTASPNRYRVKPSTVTLNRWLCKHEDNSNYWITNFQTDKPKYAIKLVETKEVEL